MIYSIITILLALGYAFQMHSYLEGWKSLPDWDLPKVFTPSTKVSILIAARNEAEGINACLQSLLEQNYPSQLYEIIVIDDHSEDATATIVESFNNPIIQVLRLSEYLKERPKSAFKKRALETGIANATGDLIVSTDADCLAGPDWLPLLVSYYETHQPKFIAAPVNMVQEKNLLQRFQSLDFMGMMGVTGAGIWKGFMNMSNGANMAYEKKVFEELGGYEGIDHVASGDDMLLMQKIAAAYPGEIGFVKNKAATIYTEAQPTLRAFINQRIRWASKSSDYEERFVTLQLALVFLFCVNIVVSLLLIPFWGKTALVLFLIQIAIKGVVDYRQLNEMSQFFYRSDLMTVFVPALFMHIAYIVVIGTLANVVKSYEWKGRKVK